MKSVAKSTAYGAAATVFRPAVSSKLFSDPLTILMYHGIVRAPLDIPDPCMVLADDFDQQMRYLSKHFEVWSLNDALARLSDGRLQRRSVVITFDDGYQSNHDYALPILEELRLPATIYVATCFVDTDTTVWTGKLQHAFAVTTAECLEWRGRRWQLITADEKLCCLLDIKTELKGSPQDDLLDTVAELTMLLEDAGSESLDKLSPYRMLDSTSIQRLAASEYIELGAHTHSHLVLSRIGKAQQEAEIRMSKTAIESITSEPCTSFAYPNGQPEDFDEDTLEILDDCGFESAVTTVNGMCGSSLYSPLQLPRVTVDGRSSFSQFKLGMFNIPGRFRN